MFIFLSQFSALNHSAIAIPQPQKRPRLSKYFFAKLLFPIASLGRFAKKLQNDIKCDDEVQLDKKILEYFFHLGINFFFREKAWERKRDALFVKAVSSEVFNACFLALWTRAPSFPTFLLSLRYQVSNLVLPSLLSLKIMRPYLKRPPKSKVPSDGFITLRFH